MSIGNTKDQGNKGNNYSYQVNTLLAIKEANDAVMAQFAIVITELQNILAVSGGGKVSTNNIFTIILNIYNR